MQNLTVINDIGYKEMCCAGYIMFIISLLNNKDSNGIIIIDINLYERVKHFCFALFICIQSDDLYGEPEMIVWENLLEFTVIRVDCSHTDTGN